MNTTFTSTKKYIAGRFSVVRFRPEDEESVEGKVIIVTGANSGIGKETTKALVQRGATVIMACRNEEKVREAIEDIKTKLGTQAKGQMVFMKVDMGELDTVRAFAEEFKSKYSKLNILICNAGVSDQNGVRLTTKDLHEYHMGTNHLGHFLLTLLLLDQLKAGAPSRVVVVASLFYAYAKLNFDDLMLEKTRNHGFLNLVPYANSKLANLLFVKELAQRVEGTGITTYALCPGLVSTNIYRTQGWFKRIHTKGLVFFGGFNCAQGCQTILLCALSKHLATENGKMYQFGKEWEGVIEKLDDQAAKKLWELSEEYVGLKNK